MSDEVYAIIDLDGYATQIREAAANSLSDGTEENLDDFISLSQIINMVKTECIGYDNNDRPLLNESVNEKIYEDTAIWIHNVGLAKLAAKDLVECAWDNECNDMVFWIKDSNPTREKNNAQPKPKQRRNTRKNKKS